MHGGDRLISKRTPFSAKLRFCNLCIIKQTNYNKLLFSCSKDRQRRVFRIWMPPTLRSSLLWWLAGRRRLTLKPLRLKVRTANKTKELRWWSHHIFLHDAPACIQGTNSQSFFGVWPCSFVIPRQDCPLATVRHWSISSHCKWDAGRVFDNHRCESVHPSFWCGALA